MTQRMELLAPAGGMEQLRTAIRFGANAVYGGMKQFGLRASAENFSKDELKEAVDYAHAHHVKFYVTLNILPTDADMSGFVAAARDALAAGVDAAIVSDLGASLVLHKQVPALKLHISTQANVYNTQTALHFHEAAGAERIVLSRELSLTDIAAMRKSLPDDLALEAFVHGAMCVAYSGRCLLSAALNGRSGNRGACAQPCRWQYHVAEEKRPGEYMPICEDEHGTYLFSSYDLCMLPHLDKLRDAGVYSLKIEGRMKTAYYVASVVSAYRHALDLLELNGQADYEAAIPELMVELEKASHRKSNTGFFFGTPQPVAGAGGFEQSMQYVADVVSDAPAGTPVPMKLKNRFYAGDDMELLTPEGSKPFTAGQLLLTESGESVPTASVAGTLFTLVLPFDAHEGDLLRGPNRNHQSTPTA